MERYLTGMGWAVAFGSVFAIGFLTGATFFLYAHHTAMGLMGR